MRNFTWNRFPIKNLLIDSLLTPIVESTYLNTDMCKFESSQKDESRWQSTDSSKAYRNTSAFKCLCLFVSPRPEVVVPSSARRRITRCDRSAQRIKPGNSLLVLSVEGWALMVATLTLTPSEDLDQNVNCLQTYAALKVSVHLCCCTKSGWCVQTCLRQRFTFYQTLGQSKWGNISKPCVENIKHRLRKPPFLPLPTGDSITVPELDLSIAVVVSFAVTSASRESLFCNSSNPNYVAMEDGQWKNMLFKATHSPKVIS